MARIKLWEIFHAMGEPTRMAIIKRIARGGKPAGESVGDLCRMLGIEMVNLSHHLGVLRTSQILINERHGRFQHYSLNPDIFAVNENGELSLRTGEVEMRLFDLEAVT